MNYDKSSFSLEEMEKSLDKSTLTMEDTTILGKKVNKALNKHYIDKTSNHLHREFNTK